MSNVPTNLIPTRITGLPEYVGSSTLGYIPYVLEGRTYKVQFANIAAVGAVPSTRVIGTGNGLEGGGDLSQNRVISIIPHGVGYSQLDFTGVTAGTYGSADTIPSLTIDATGRVTAAVNTPVVLSNYVPSSRTVTAGAGLTGGGQLNNNITIALNPSNATPQPLGAASPGTGTQAARDDHVHPAVDLTDTSETQGVLPLGRGGTGVALSPVVGAVIYADNDSLNQTTAGNAGQILKSAGGLGAPYWDDLAAGGTVTSVSVVSANGFAGTVANPSTTPAITIKTTITGVVKGDGTAISAAVAGTDYVAPGAITTSGLTMATSRLLGRTTAATGAVEQITVGTGLTLSGGSLVNSAPDQTVTLTGGTAISISGTYPSFTITNTAPDQIVSLTGAGTTVVTGTYPNFTITSNDAYTGTVTSVAASGGTTGLTFSGSPITTSGTLTLGGTLNVANGGTGATTATGARTNLGAAASGANSDITSLSGITGSISTVDYIDFDLGATVTDAAGRIWFDGQSTLNIGMSANVTGHAMEDNYFYVKASSAITKGQLVMFTGTVGASGTPTAAPASGLGVNDGQLIMGIAAESIALNGFGLIQSFGPLRGFNTSGSPYGQTWADGDLLYYNSAYAGGLTNVQPTAPGIRTPVAAVLTAGSGGSGSVLIRITLGSVLGGTDSNVYINGLANNDLLQYDSGNLRWRNIAASSVSVGTATNLAGGAANRIAYQTGAGATGFITAPTIANTFLEWSGTAFQWSSNPLGTVTSVAMTVPTGLTVSGSPITTSGTLAVSLQSGYSIPTTASQTNWDTAYTDRLKWDGGSSGLVAATGRTSLGATTVGSNFFTLTNPSAITFPQINADNTVSALSASAFRAAIGAGTGSGSVTSVDVSGGTTGLTTSGGPVTSSGTITLAGTLVVANGGTGATTATGARTNLGATTVGSNFFTLTNPSAITFPRINADNTVSALNASDFRTAIGAGTGSGSVTSVDVSGGTTGLTFSGGPVTTSGTITMAGTLAVGNGGTGTSTAFTAGSIVFAGASGVYSQKNANLFWDNTNNRLGVGTTSPGFTIEATGDLRLGGGGDLRLGSATGTTGSSGDSSIFSDANDMNFSVGSNIRMYIANGGNVGIGNTGPGYRLDISSADTTANLGYAMRIRANSTAAGGTIQFTDSGVTAQWGFLASTATALTLDCSGAGSVVFRTNGSERGRFNSSGNLLVGTTTDKNRLTVTAGSNVNSPTLGSAGGIAYFTNTDVAYGLNIGNSAADGRVWLQAQRTDGTATAYSLTLNEAGGNVAIGTATASDTLTVLGSGSSWQINAKYAGTTQYQGSYLGLTTTGASTNYGQTVLTHYFNTGAGDLTDTGFAIQQRTTGSGFVNTIYNFSYKNQLHQWYTSGSERMRVISTGKVLIGSSGDADGSPFQVNANSFGNGIYTARFENSASGTGVYNAVRWVQGASGSAVGIIGTGGSTVGNAAFQNRFVVGTQNNTALTFVSNDTFRGMIDGGGQFWWGAQSTIDTVSYAPFQITNALAINTNTTAGTTAVSFFNGQGSGVRVGYIGTSGSSTSYNTSSDARLKENIVDAADAGDLIDSIQVRQFDWRINGEHQRYGMIAQELDLVFPEAVGHGPTEEDMLAVDYSKLVPMLVKELQSVRARLAQLEGK